jgi:hypothetical protein
MEAPLIFIKSVGFSTENGTGIAVRTCYLLEPLRPSGEVN